MIGSEEIRAEEYRQALAVLLPSLHKHKFRLLECLMQAPNHTLSLEEIIRRMESDGQAPLNNWIGQLSRDVYEQIKRLPDDKSRPKHSYSHILIRKHRKPIFKWELRENVVIALESLRFSSTMNLPGEFTKAEARSYVEGSLIRRYVNTYERDTNARAECLRLHGYYCSCCEMNMAAFYSLDRDFIHVHHLVPLSALGQEYKVDPEHDLRPVCPNCHSVIHLTEPPRTIHDIRSLLGKT